MAYLKYEGDSNCELHSEREMRFSGTYWKSILPVVSLLNVNDDDLYDSGKWEILS